MNEPELVNGISGDMLKHIQAEHLHRVALRQV
jgi:CRISPR-associated protein Cst2